MKKQKKLDAFHMLLNQIENIKYKISQEDYYNLKDLAKLTYQQGEILGRKFEIKETINILNEII